MVFIYFTSPRFEQPSAHHQSGESVVSIHHLVHITLCSDCLVCRYTGIPGSHLHRVICTRWCIDTIDSPDWWWALGCSKHVERSNK